MRGLMTSHEHPLTLLLRQLDAHGALPAEDRDALLALPHRVRRLDPGSYLVREGDVPVHCSVLVTGYAFRQKVTGSGARQILSTCRTCSSTSLITACSF